ncbi:DUF2207 domain-containing protein [Paenibacillus sp. JSM ZJ436]|uniref:DUF2207 domain-containing protein n=1 Tax=Paenibacillus sp. JSM ZJ436 TaxID=3376190 RepID=UPI00378ABEA9
MMISRRIYRYMLSAALLLLALFTTACDHERSYSMEQSDVYAYVMPDGDLYVEEMHTYRFNGSYNRVTRHLAVKERSQVEFFEAYELESHERSSLPLDELPLLDSGYDEESGFFYASSPSEDETRHYFYRYRISQVVKRTKQAADLDWSFFEQNDQELNQVNIDVFLPDRFTGVDVHTFIKDRTRGGVMQKNPHSGAFVRIHYDTLSEIGNARLRVLFPQEVVVDAPFAKQSLSLRATLAAEQEQMKRRIEREQRFEGLRWVLLGLGAAVWGGVMLLWLAPQKVAARRAAQRKDLSLVWTLDPKQVAYIYRRGRLQERDFISGLFSLHQRGMLHISEVQASPRLASDPYAPKVMLQFELIPDLPALSEEDVLLIDWLFTEQEGRRIFYLESITGPTSTEKHSRNELANKRYAALWKLTQRKVKEWSSQLASMEAYHRFAAPSSMYRVALIAAVAVHFTIVILMKYFDAAPYSSLLWTILVLGVAGLWALRSPQPKWVMLLFLGLSMLGGYQVMYGGLAAYHAMVVLGTAAGLLSMPKKSLSKQGLEMYYLLLRWKAQLDAEAGPLQEEGPNRKFVWEMAVLLDAGGWLRKQAELDQQLAGTHRDLDEHAALSACLYTQSHLMPLTASSAATGAHSTHAASSSDGGSAGTGAD